MTLWQSWRVLFVGTSELVHRPRVARRGLESALARFVKYHSLILCDIAYISKRSEFSRGL
jgi:hypothetical protein